jgi:hypothetical protein
VGVTATDLAYIPMSPVLESTLARGVEFAGTAGAEETTLEHLLVALCDDPDAIAVLQASAIDNDRLRADVMSRAAPEGPLDQDTPTGAVGVSYDVKRILEAAAAAAKGSRRREINGAIVLAAIVGDGRSLASDLLQAHGLTFDAAIRALQAALAASSEVRSPAPAADDVLARARERVQSRSAPSLRELMGDAKRGVTPQPPAALDMADQQSSVPRHEPEMPALTMPRSMPREADEANSDHAKEKAPQDLHAAEPHEDVHQTIPGEAGAPGLAIPTAFQTGISQGRPAWPNAPEPPDTQAPRAPGMPAAGGHPAPEPAFAPTSELFPGQGGEIPDFIRQRKSTVTPPPIPPAPPMPVRAPAASVATSALQVPSPVHPQIQSGLRADTARPHAPPPVQQRAPAKRGKRSAGGKVEAGKLAENIPRAMRIGKTVRVEVRIAKASIRGLEGDLAGPSVGPRSAGSSPKAVAVRIRAPEGGFHIETASPETLWIESNSDFADDDVASWRFLITPNERGWSPLQIIASARTIGPDGLAAEAALPDQTVDVKVRRNPKRLFTKVVSWGIAALIGGLLATFGQPVAKLLGLMAQNLTQ